MTYYKNGLKVRRGTKTMNYWRNPTKGEIKFGYGAIHYRDFDIAECFNDDGSFRLALIAENDGLKYYYNSYEYSTTRKYKIH
jgi:hypothetical protein